MYDYNCPDCNEAKLQSDKNARKINEVIDQVNQIIDNDIATTEYLLEKADEIVGETAEIKVNEVLDDLNSEINKIYSFKDGFEYNFDDGYCIFSFDDWRGDLEDVYNVFKSRNVPFCASIPGEVIQNRINQGLSLDLLYTLENNDCELMAHGYTANPITVDTPLSTVIYEIEKPKRIMNELGLNVDGFVKVGGQGATETLEPWINIVKKFYKYGSGCGNSEPYLSQRMSLGSMPIDSIKAHIDNAKNNKTVKIFYGHTINGSEGDLTKEKLETIIDYAIFKGVKIVTFRELYNKCSFGHINEEMYVQKHDSIYNAKEIKKLVEKNVFIAGLSGDFTFNQTNTNTKIVFDKKIANKGNNISISDGSIKVNKSGIYKIDMYLNVNTTSYKGQFKYIISPTNIYYLSNVSFNGYTTLISSDIRTFTNSTTQITLELWKNVDTDLKIGKDTLIVINEL